MFDIGFTELLVCMVVALVVIGPEQLPGAVRTAGLWIGRLKRSLRDTRNEIERQIGADDIRRQLHNEEVLQNIEDMRNKLEKTLLDVHQYEEDANANAQHQISTYGPPDELPDHAHGNEAATKVPPATPALMRQPSDASDTGDVPMADSTSTNTHQAATTSAQSGTGH